MNPTDPNRASPNVVQLLQAERTLEPVSDALRSRALLRAQQSRLAPAAPMLKPGSFPRTLRFTAPWVIGAMGLAAAAFLHWRATLARERPTAAGGSVASTMPANLTPAVAAPEASGSAPAPLLGVAATTELVTPAAPRVEPRVLELTLLESARKATRAGDFTTALAIIHEHEQRFARGRLLEEREALRVKSLIGLGRRDEAVRAAESFRKRFPKSVLLPSVSRMVGVAD